MFLIRKNHFGMSLYRRMHCRRYRTIFTSYFGSGSIPRFYKFFWMRKNTFKKVNESFLNLITFYLQIQIIVEVNIVVKLWLPHYFKHKPKYKHTQCILILFNFLKKKSVILISKTRTIQRIFSIFCCLFKSIPWKT